MQSQLHYFILCFCLMVSTVQAQIAYQGFEQNASDTWGTTFSTPPCTSGADRWDYSTALGGITPSAGTQFWGIQDLNSPCGSAAGETITFATTNVSGFTGVSINFDYNIAGFDSGDDVFYTLILDGVAQTQVHLLAGGTGTPAGSGTGNTSTGGYTTETINIPNGTNTVGFILFVDQNGTDQAGFDNFILNGTAVAACPHTVTSIAPISGPVGTEVSIIGTGFTASTTVTFNGVAAAAINFINATTLVATIPVGSTTGAVVVTESACNVTAATGFTLLEQSGGCGAIFSDLVISEIYDAGSGSLGYIEIYNGTGAAIQLADYRVERYGNLTGGTPQIYSFPTMMIADGQVVVGKVSNDGNLGGITPDFTFGTTTGGFNADDRLELVLIAGGTTIDDWHDDAVAGGTGYSYLRSTTITGPNPNYAAGEWTGNGTESTSDIGLYVVAAGAPTINTQPTDLSACAINLSVAATAGGGGALTYQWFFNENDGSATTWTVVTGAAFTGTIVAGATSSNLSITGDLSAVDGYQFYCQVTEGGSCAVPSEAVQFTLNAERFFRSAMTGDWTNVNTWEMASSAAGPWMPTCVYPLFDNSDYIHIQNTHTVSVNQDIVVDEVVIETGGTVSINNNRLWTFNNGTGIDLDVQGTLIDHGNGVGNGMSLTTNSASWVLGINGEVIKTGSSTVAEYRDGYEGGIAGIPATATWRFRHDGNSGVVAVITENMFYPNLYFESTSGNHSFNGATEVFQGTSGFTTVKGSLYIGNTGTGTIDVFNRNTNASMMQVVGDLIIGGNGSGGTSKIENNQGGTVGTGIEVQGNLIVNSNGQLDYEDGTAAGDGLFRLHGNWTDLNTGNGFEEGESTVEFVGTTTQSVNKVTGDEDFYNVVVNKASGNLQNNANNMIIENDMTFTNGIVLTSTVAYLVFEPTATATTASNASHVDGPVRKETNTGVITTFTYPTGDQGIYGAIGIETRFHNGETFVAEYFNNGYGTYNVNTAELDHVSSLEYWILDKLGATGENVKVTLHWGPHSNVLTPASIRVAHFFTEAPSLVDQWEAEGATPLITGNAANGTVTSDYVTSFSPFTLSDVVTQTTLPLELLRFEATKVERTAELLWEVANEITGDRYCVERSVDAQNFETLACFDATSDNHLMTYNYTDQTPFVGNNYYRIHQIDHLGTDHYTITKVLNFEDPNGVVLVYPSPADDKMTIEMPTLTTGAYTVSIIDALGRELIRSQLNKNQAIYQLNTHQFAAGTYVLKIEAPNGSVNTQKVTVSH